MKKYLCTLVVTAFVSLTAFGQVEIDNSNNVGIGIATPTQKLDINGQLRVRTIPLNNALNEVLVRDANGVVHYRGLETISYWTKSGDSLFSDTACFVGIGTNSPVEQLHVQGALRVELADGHVTILKTKDTTGTSSTGMTIEAKDELRLNTFVPDIPFAGTYVRISPPDTTAQASFDSFFDIFTDIGECRYRAGRIDTGGLSGTGFRLGEQAEMASLSGAGENGGIIKLRPDVTRLNGGGALTVSNIGSSGLDGVSMRFDADTTSGAIEYRGFGNDPDDLCVLVIRPSTVDNTGKLVVSNIGSSGLDGVRMRFDADTTSGFLAFQHLFGDPDFEFVISPSNDTTKSNLVVSNLGSSGLDGVRASLGNSSIDGDHSADPGGAGHGGRLVLTPDKRITDGGKLKVSNLGSSGCDGVSIDLGEDNRLDALDEIAGVSPGGTRFTVDSFFDITYEIDFIQPSHIGFSGERVGTELRMVQNLNDRVRLSGVSDTIASVPSELRIQPDVSANGGGGTLVVSNIGSSGQDGVRVTSQRVVQTEILSMDLVSADPFGILGPRVRMNTDKGSVSFGNTGSAASSGISLMDESAGNTGGHINFLPNSVCLFPGNATYASVMARNDGGGTALGVRMTLDQNTTALEPAMDFNRDGSMDIVVRRPGGNNGQLTISNIGSSGEDGVRVALSEGTQTTVPIEIVALQLRSTGPIDIVSLDNSDLAWAWSFESTDQRLTRTVTDSTPGSTATPDVYVFDGDLNEVRRTGPPVRQYVHSGLMRRYLYNPDPLSRSVTVVHQDLDNPGLPTFFTEYDHLQQRITLTTPQLQIIGNLSKLSGNFKIDHPQDPYNKYLVHSFVESPDMMNIYNGNITTDEKGYATVTMPDYFASLNMDFRYQLTAMGVFAQAIVKEKLADNKFVIQTDKANVEVSWQVTGIRQDTYAKENRIQVEVDKEESKKGKLLYEPKKELGLNE